MFAICFFAVVFFVVVVLVTMATGIAHIFLLKYDFQAIVFALGIKSILPLCLCDASNVLLNLRNIVK